MALIAAGIAAAIEFALESAAAVEAAGIAAGLVEGELAAGTSMAEMSGATAEFGYVLPEGVSTAETQYAAGRAIGRGAGNITSVGAFVADPVSAVTSRVMGSMIPEGSEIAGLWGGDLGEAVAGRMHGMVDGPFATMSNEMVRGIGYEYGSMIGRAVPGSIPAKLSVGVGKRMWKHMRDHALKTGEEVPFSTPGELIDDYNSRGESYKHTKKIHHQVVSTYRAVHPTTESMGRPLLPGKKTVTHRWSSGNSNVSVSTGDTGLQVIKVNTPIDIGGSLSSGDGHEPMGYTQYAAMYEQCYVKECRVIVDYFNAEESGQTPASGAYSGVIMGLCPKDDTGELGTIGHYEELDGCTWRVVPPEGTGRMTYAIKPNRFFGISDKTAGADDTLRIVGVTQPSNLLYLHAFVQRMNIANTDVINVRMHWTVEMDIVWMEPKALAQS